MSASHNKVQKQVMILIVFFFAMILVARGIHQILN